MGVIFVGINPVSPQVRCPMAHTPAVRIAASMGGVNEENTIATAVTIDTSNTLNINAPTKWSGNTPPFHHTSPR